ncbi:MAG: hypothetical protein AAF639_26615 [Chloroflexota bacterium]
MLLLTLYIVLIVRNGWVGDDAFITFRTVRNFADGYGPVWNVGERVQSFTHPLWMFLLSFVYFFTQEIYYTSIILCVIVSGVCLWIFIQYSARSFFSLLLGYLLLILSKAFIDYSTSALENPLSHLLIGLCLYVYFRLNQKEPNFLLVLATASLALVNRLDLLLIVGPLLLHTIILLVRYEIFAQNQLYTPDSESSWSQKLIDRSIQAIALTGRIIPQLVLGFSPIIIWELFSLFYYGFPFPNTMYAKLGTSFGAWQTIEQSMFYMLDIVSTDPLTLIVLVVGIVYAMWQADLSKKLLAAGVFFYLAYMLSIGGDFMTGRFQSVPFFCIVVLIAHERLDHLQAMYKFALVALILLVGLMNPPQSPLFSNMHYDFDIVPETGIADERGFYYDETGLLVSHRFNRLYYRGSVTGTPDPVIFDTCGIGFFGFVASPRTPIIDICGLADPLLARLPRRYEPDWRVGHPHRVVPDGYVGTLRTKENLLSDPNLARYYDKLYEIIAGDLWSMQRIQTIIAFNLGFYDHLIDQTRYRYPALQHTTLHDIQQIDNEMTVTPDGLQIDFQVIRQDDSQDEPQDGPQDEPQDGPQTDTPISGSITLDDITQATHLEIETDSNYYQLLYLNIPPSDEPDNGLQYREEQIIAQQTHAKHHMLFDEHAYSLVTIPLIARIQGFTHIHFIPLYPESFEFSNIKLVDIHKISIEIVDVQPMQDATPSPQNAIHPDVHTEFDMDAQIAVDLLRYYYYYFYRGTKQEFDTILPSLRQQLAEIETIPWHIASFDMMKRFLYIPDPNLQNILKERLPKNIILTNEAGTKKIRFLGQSQKNTPTVLNQRLNAEENGPDLTHATDTKLQFSLFMELLSALDESHSLWFHIIQLDTSQPNVDSTAINQWMIYDYPPEMPMNHWKEGYIYQITPEIQLPPGKYELSFGVWTTERTRLYVEGAEPSIEPELRPNTNEIAAPVDSTGDENGIYWINLGQFEVFLSD